MAIDLAILLRRSGSIPVSDAYDVWFAVTGTVAELPVEKHLPDLPRRLQKCFDGIRDTWLEIARRIGASGNGAFAHTATGAAYNNDFGLMLAWAALVRDFSGDTRRVLVLCDDPWLFRHLASITGVDTGRAPRIWPIAARMFLRGIAARARLGLRLAHMASALKSTCRVARSGTAAIVVYGHPQSDANGNDAYFGNLMVELPQLDRALHTDCMLVRARELCRDGRSFSLHGWGSPLFAVATVFLRWRLSREELACPEYWLLRRAAAHENSGGALAITCWQAHCQARWVSAMKPCVIAWPWENHPWERKLARTAHTLGVASVGYQHAVIGRHQFNFSPASNPDGARSLPDTIMCNGPAYRDQLVALGHDPARLKMGGAFRISRDNSAFHDPAGPVYIALSSVLPISRQMLDAVSASELDGIRFIVKDHPLYPVTVHESANLKRTHLTIPASGGLRAVVYSTGTTGLEGLLAGVPTYRFLPADRIAPDILPTGIEVPEQSADQLVETLARHGPGVLPQPLDWSEIMAPVDVDLWRSTLAP